MHTFRVKLDALPEPEGWDVAPTYSGLAMAFAAQSKCNLALRMYEKERTVKEVPM